MYNLLCDHLDNLCLKDLFNDYVIYAKSSCNGTLVPCVDSCVVLAHICKQRLGDLSNNCIVRKMTPSLGHISFW